jgi:uncharacterized membrane protein YedE/YeeE
MMAPLVAAFAAGLLFAVGLGIGGMTQPARVIGFLDVAGRWDPTLALVMGGALAVFAPLNALIRRRRAPLLAERFEVTTRRDVDAALLLGAATFGVGWGLAGFCPGPAIVSLASGQTAPLVFAATMLAGMALYRRVTRPVRPRSLVPHRVDG